MRVPIFQLDSFTTRRFAGNPAAVVVLQEFLDDALMQAVAAENNLAETAFFVPTGPAQYHLRWFTPEVEVDLCGHATLAAAFVTQLSTFAFAAAWTNVYPNSSTKAKTRKEPVPGPMQPSYSPMSSPVMML